MAETDRLTKALWRVLRKARDNQFFTDEELRHFLKENGTEVSLEAIIAAIKKLDESRITVIIRRGPEAGSEQRAAIALKRKVTRLPPRSFFIPNVREPERTPEESTPSQSSLENRINDRWRRQRAVIRKFFFGSK